MYAGNPRTTWKTGTLIITAPLAFKMKSLRSGTDIKARRLSSKPITVLTTVEQHTIHHIDHHIHVCATNSANCNEEVLNRSCMAVALTVKHTRYIKKRGKRRTRPVL